MTPYVLRPMRDSDRGFVFSTWMRSTIASEGGDWERDRTRRLELHGEISEALRCAVVTLAVDREDEDLIFGYVVADGAEVLKTYVRRDFREYDLDTILERSVKGST